MSGRECVSSEPDAPRCTACGRVIPRDALLCPYCGSGVLVALPLVQGVEPAPGSFPPGSMSWSRRRWLRWMPVAGAWAFLCLSIACCLTAVLVLVSHSRDGVGLWEDIVSLLAGGDSRGGAAPTATPAANEVPAGPEPTETPVAPSPLETPAAGPSSLAAPGKQPGLVQQLSRHWRARGTVERLGGVSRPGAAHAISMV